MNKILLIFFIFLLGCGYQPLYKKNSAKNLEFYNVITSGDENISKRIIDNLNIEEDKNNNTLNSLKLISQLKIEETSKDLKGEVKTYRLSLIVEVFEIKNEEVIKTRKFVETFSYNNKDSKLKLVEYENKIKKIMINRISGKITFYLTLL